MLMINVVITEFSNTKEIRESISTQILLCQLRIVVVLACWFMFEYERPKTRAKRCSVVVRLEFVSLNR